MRPSEFPLSEGNPERPNPNPTGTPLPKNPEALFCSLFCLQYGEKRGLKLGKERMGASNHNPETQTKKNHALGSEVSNGNLKDTCV